MIKSVNLIMRYSSGLSPALRTVRVASGMCWPLQQHSASSGDALLMYIVKEKSCTLHLPEPAPPPTCAEPELPTCQDHESTSISPPCFLSRDSPAMPAILRN